MNLPRITARCVLPTLGTHAITLDCGPHLSLQISFYVDGSELTITEPSYFDELPGDFQDYAEQACWDHYNGED